MKVWMFFLVLLALASGVVDAHRAAPGPVSSTAVHGIGSD